MTNLSTLVLELPDHNTDSIKSGLILLTLKSLRTLLFINKIEIVHKVGQDEGHSIILAKVQFGQFGQFMQIPLGLVTLPNCHSTDSNTTRKLRVRKCFKVNLMD